MKEPKVHVGILFEPQIEFVLLNTYLIDGTEISGKQVVTYDEGKILWNGRRYEELLFEPRHEQTDAFELLDVTIGINFHWERKEDQRFLGALKIIVENGKLTGINVIRVEDYLTSVISSEMSATASLELLKAHAVISRSWLLAQIQKNKEITETHADYSAFTQTEEELIRWYDREDHTRFDVCADDHCQRYQGITRASTDIVKQAIAATRGQVLTSDGKICDARFSKCCGGAFEEFQYCWEDIKYPYLAKQRDYRTENGKADNGTLPDLTREVEADRWIRTSPKAFCNTTDKKILSQVLNNYDQETTDFYRWKVEYTQDELSKLIKERSGIDYGQIIDLIPVARGTSARLWKLKIVGSQRTLTIGKELEIRRTLSPSHLYSSAFVVDKEDISPEGIPGRFILTGAGWGHGVGLCQIGAAVMGEQGYKYDAILLHYYIGANIDKLYE
ncbi:SpoIID/LytB domain-containing protein [Bacteroides fluxus]|jgi:SpoIID/LytB domain protein|uniref:SpoIID/LytB domain protein n=1 Tax=Bacteroides fluxus YIT 12057 TaxID=763034 RepID=F3PWZ4_9BACE|nr:SpoIID/LytB domain-containing protein [Bacteroides fluxus]EGF52073.1 SpoIID/LytB domain protein [Bacteroides fluxus YIT 12057]